MIDSIREYIYNLMNDKTSGVFSSFMKAILFVVSLFYGMIVKCHSYLYGSKLFKSYEGKISAISVGNITLGGTGKTPFVIMLAENISKRNKKCAVLIRGYGEDEWKLLGDRLAKYNTKVFVGRDRIKSAKDAEKDNMDIIILDDGFQHRPLSRKHDIVLIDSTNPFGNGCIFPRGILREPLSALKRANLIVLTKVDKGKDLVSEAEEKIKKIAPDKKILKAVHMPLGLYGMWKGEKGSLSDIKGKSVCLVSAICDPAYFRYTAEKAGALVEKEYIFKDHYSYTQDDLNHIVRECKAKKIDFIITTEKDAVKLKKLVRPKEISNIFVLAVELQITEGKENLNALCS